MFAAPRGQGYRPVRHSTGHDGVQTNAFTLTKNDDADDALMGRKIEEINYNRIIVQTNPEPMMRVHEQSRQLPYPPLRTDHPPEVMNDGVHRLSTETVQRPP